MTDSTQSAANSDAALAHGKLHSRELSLHPLLKYLILSLLWGLALLYLAAELSGSGLWLTFFAVLVVALIVVLAFDLGLMSSIAGTLKVKSSA